MTEDMVFIRPSGNPAPPEAFLDMLKSGDVEPGDTELVSVDSIRIFAGGMAAVCCFTQHSTFVYKGVSNDDIAKYTVVLEKDNEGKWKMIHAHRGTGQPPKTTTSAPSEPAVQQ